MNNGLSFVMQIHLAGLVVSRFHKSMFRNNNAKKGKRQKAKQRQAQQRQEQEGKRGCLNRLVQSCHVIGRAQRFRGPLLY